MKVLKSLLLLFLFGINSNMNAQIVTIPDANFVTFLQTNYPSCMNGNQMDIACTEIQNEDSLSIHNLNIVDLSGIENFINLRYLLCTDNFLTGFPSLPNTIEYLACSSNQITAFPTLPSSLQFLYCGSNQLTNLPVLPNALKELYCGENLLTSLPALPNSLLELNCYNNQLTSLPALNSGLIILDCSFNQLTSLSTLPNSLNSLNCYSNLLTSLPNLPSSLITLTCIQNQLTSLPLLPESLLELFCSNNQLVILPQLPSALQKLLCGENQLNSLPVLPNSLQELLCANNQISCFPQFPSSIFLINIDGNTNTCLPNYLLSMNPSTLALPLCISNDVLGNPNGCNASIGIVGSAYSDQNNNCVLNSSDSIFSHISIKLFDQNNTLLSQTFTATNGIFQFPEDPGTYIVKVDTLNEPFTLQCQGNNLDTTIILTAQNSFADSINFAITCKPGFDIGTKSILTNGWVFPGQSHELKIAAGDLSQFYNFSCASGVSGQVQISVSGPVSYQINVAGTLTPLVIGNTYTYDIADFGSTNIFESFGLIFQTDTTGQAGDQICVTVSVTPELGDNNPSNNLYEFCYEVVNSYDPNMKEVFPVNVAPGYADYFTYTIHFQNTGTAPAFNIRLLDTLDANLDLETFQILNYSHYQTANIRNTVLTFHFPNIQLPNSTSNLEGSKGYVQYRIKPKANLALGTQIKNTANIYFDYNEPIVTNTTVNEYVLTNSLHENEQVSVKVYPNPFSSSTTIAFGQVLTKADIHLYNVYGQEVRKISNFSGTKLQIAKENLNAGIYFLQVRGEHKTQKIKLIIAE